MDRRKYWWYTEEWKGDRRWDTKEKEKYQKGRKDLIYEGRVYEIEREREREDLRNKWERWCERKRKEKSRSIKKKRTYAKGRKCKSMRIREGENEMGR